MLLKIPLFSFLYLALFSKRGLIFTRLRYRRTLSAGKASASSFASSLRGLQLLLFPLESPVLKYEGPNSTYKFQDVDPDFLAGMNKGIQGFKIKINKLEGKAKLSQNHPLQRRELIVNHLEQSSQTDEQKIASLMKVNLP
jgi:hypothetical protein